jgi:hypothetical protein
MKWSNTIMGKRKQRLLTVEQKEEEAEERRLLVDKQWKEIRDKEKVVALEKARVKRLYQNPEVRVLHSSLMLQNVVAERDLQLIKNQSTKDRLKNDNKEFYHSLVKSVIDGAKKDKAKDVYMKEERDKTVKVLRAQIDERATETEKNAKDEADMNKRLFDEGKWIFNDKSASNNVKTQMEIKLEEVKLQEYKRARALSDSARETALDERNKRFNDVQLFINDKRKEIIKDNLEARAKEMERIGNRGYKEMIKERQGLRNFEQAFQISRDMDYDTLNATEVERRRVYLKNANTTGDIRSQVYSNYKAEDDAFLASCSKSKDNAKWAPKYVSSEEENKVKRGVKCRDLQKHVRVQIASNADKRAKSVDAGVKIDAKNRAYLKTDDLDFQRYGIFFNY